MDALGGRVAVGARILDGLLQLFDDVPRRGHVGVAHAEVDDVDARRAEPRLDGVDMRKDIRRQAPDAVKIVVHGISSERLGESALHWRADQTGIIAELWFGRS
jgi:hypothetical protein